MYKRQYLNVAGGFRLDEPAADLPILLAVASSVIDTPVPEGTVAFCEVGLTGELRSVVGGQQRMAEIRRLGFKRCILPRHGADQLTAPEGLEVLQVLSLIHI